MVYRATRSFTGRITMIKGEVREISDPELEKDLLRCGYIVGAEIKKKAVKEPDADPAPETVIEEKPKAKKTTKKSGGGKNA